MEPSPTEKYTSFLLWRFYFGLAVLEGIIVLWLYLGSKSEGGLLFGVSAARLIIIAGVLLPLALAGWLLATSWTNPRVFADRQTRWTVWLVVSARWGYLTLLAGIFLIWGIYALMATPDVQEPFARGFLDRLLPLIAWITALSAQTLLLLVYLRYRSTGLKIGRIPKLTWILVFYFIFVFAGWFWVTRTIYPLASTRTGWNLVGVPIMEQQVFVAWGAGLMVILFAHFLFTSKKWTTWLNTNRGWPIDVGIGLLIWVSAVLLWQSKPISPNWFVSNPAPPNYEYYPLSDARNYDLASQSALVGEGFRFFNSKDVRRPLHAAYLTVLHLLAGQNYESVVFLQILVLALLPVALYFVTKSLSNRAAGVTAAVLIMLREANSIAASAYITSSHAKLIMVDLLVTLAVVFFAFWAILWLKQAETKSLSALISGGSLGLAMLIRLETSVLSLSPLLLASLILLPKKKFRIWTKQIVLFFFGIIIVISPWVYRNWQISGRIFVDSRAFRYLVIIQRFKPLEQSQPATPAATPSAPAAASPTPYPSPSTPVSPAAPQPTLAPRSGYEALQLLAENYLHLSIQNPGELVGIFAAHFLNNQIQTILIYPSTYRALDSTIGFMGHRDFSRYWQECCSLTDYTRRLPFWRKWDGGIPSQSILPIFLNTLILIIGITDAWRRKRLVSLMPALAMFFYFVFYAALRNSGGRYILPVDWSMALYYSIGLIQITLLLFGLIKRKKLVYDLPLQHEPGDAGSPPEHLLRMPAFYFAVLIFFSIGLVIPGIEHRFPLRYDPLRSERMLDSLFNSQSIPENVRLDLRAFLDNGGIALSGRGMYPQFLPAGYGTEGESLEARPYPRFAFTLVSTYNFDITLPVDKAPVFFPNASDSLALICSSDSNNRPDPLAVAVYDHSGSLAGLYLRSPFPHKLSCPLPPVP
jgi:hypothetical protein